jgi:hypothetical protein
MEWVLLTGSENEELRRLGVYQVDHSKVAAPKLL